MLGAMLPTKLSYALLKNNSLEIQRTLDSNYGLFGMVVTNCTAAARECPGQQIIYMTNSQLSWRTALRTVDLENYPYDLLRDPPPLFQEHGFDNSRDLTWEKTERTNLGRVIGRVYYIRGIPPSFLTAYSRWLKQLPGSLLSDSGANKYYALTLSVFLLGGLVCWSTVEWLLFQKWLQKRQTKQENDRMLRELVNLRQQLQGKLSQISTLIAEREQYAMELSNYQKSETQRIKELEAAITQVENQRALKSSTNLFDQKMSELQHEILRREAAITKLERAIKQQKQNEVRDAEVLATAQRRLQALVEQQAQAQQKLEEYDHSCKQLQDELARQQQEKQKTTTLAEMLRKQLQEAEQKILEAQQKQSAMEQSLAELSRQKVQDDQKLKALEKKIAETREEQDDLTMNKFEQLVGQYLKATPQHQSGQWRSLGGLDVSRRKYTRQVTDHIVIASACVFVIEAKCYQGNIRAEGDAKRTAWFMQKVSGIKIPVKCGRRRNPYEQLHSYVDNVRDKFDQSGAQEKIWVYGIVVFDTGADVSEVSSQIDGFYRITTLDNLLQIIEEIETERNRYTQGKNKLSPKEIEDLLCGRPLLKAA